MPSRTETFAVHALSVAASADTIQNHLSSMPGIHQVTVNTAIRTMDVTFDDAKITKEDILKAIQACGYDACLRHEALPCMLEAKDSRNLKTRLSFSISLLTPLALILPCSTLFFIGLLAAILCLQKEQAITCLHHLKHKQWDDQAVTACLFIAFLPVICLLFITKNQIHTTAAAWTAVTGIRLSLLASAERKENQEKQRFAPAEVREKAHLLKGSQEMTISPDELQPGDLLVLRKGDTIPADGTISEGAVRIENSQGEKHVRDDLFAGEKVCHGYCTCRVEKAGSKTAIATLWHKALQNTDTVPDSILAKKKKDIQISTGIMAAVFVIALLITRQLSAAFVSALAIPASIYPCAMAAFTAKTQRSFSLDLARQNLFLQTRRSLEDQKMETIFLEQDDIVTSRELTVCDFLPGKDIDIHIMEMNAGDAITHRRDHFAKALQRYLRSQKLTSESAGAFCAIRNDSCGKTTKLEIPADIKKAGLDTAFWDEAIKAMETEGKEIRLLHDGSHIIGLVSARKEILPHAKDAILSLKQQDMHVVLFAHGTKSPAGYLQKETGVDEVKWNVSWNQKEELLKKETENGKACAFVCSTDMASHSASLQIRMHSMQDDASDIITPGNETASLPVIFKYQRQMSDTLLAKQNRIQLYHTAVMVICLVSAIFVHSLFVPYLLSIASVIFQLLNYNASNRVE